MLLSGETAEGGSCWVGGLGDVGDSGPFVLAKVSLLVLVGTSSLGCLCIKNEGFSAVGHHCGDIGW